MSDELRLISDSLGRTQQAKSINEYNVAIALGKLEIPFIYEFELAGGHWVTGGISIDFVVWNPLMTPLEVDEAYWHKDDSRERWRANIIFDYFNQDAVRLTGEESASVGSAVSALRSKL